MRSLISTFVRRASRLALAACSLAACLAAANIAQAAYGVSVNQEGDTLYIVGDDNANTVSIVGAEDDDGTVGVYVVDVPWVYTDVSHIHVDLGEGNNFLGMDRINILGSITVVTGDGWDEVDLGGWGYGASLIGGDVNIATAGGRDTVQVEDVSVFGSITIDTAAGSDIVELGDDGILFSIQGYSVPLRTADGGSFQADVAERVEGPSDLTASPDDDEAQFFMGLVYFGGLPTGTGGLYVFTGDGRDQVGISLMQVDVETIIELGQDDDRLQLQHPNHFSGDFSARGEQGSDFLYDDPGNYYESAPQFQSFELP